MSEKETNDLMLIEKLQKLLKAGNRALNHYPYLVKAALLVKLATTLANKETGALSAVKAEAIEKPVDKLWEIFQKSISPSTSTEVSEHRSI